MQSHPRVRKYSLSCNSNKRKKKFYDTDWTGVLSTHLGLSNGEYKQLISRTKPFESRSTLYKLNLIAEIFSEIEEKEPSINYHQNSLKIKDHSDSKLDAKDTKYITTVSGDPFSHKNKNFEAAEFFSSQNLGDLIDPNDALGIVGKNFSDSIKIENNLNLYSYYSKIAAKLLGAGEELEEILSTYPKCIDKKFLYFLYERISNAYLIGDTETARTMDLLALRIKLEIQNENNSPALRLLCKILTQSFSICDYSKTNCFLGDYISYNFFRETQTSNLPSDIISLSFAVTHFDAKKKFIWRKLGVLTIDLMI